MRKILFITGVIVAFFATQCTQQKKLTYTFPSFFEDSLRPRLTADCEAGRGYYKLYCSGCHKVKNATGVPVFTREQLRGYSPQARLGSDPGHDVMKNMTDEEFRKIIMFLSYLDQGK